MTATPAIRRSTVEDVPAMFEVINDSAEAYRGIIPTDEWHDPYMPLDRLQREISEGVEFWVYEDGGGIVGVMGIQAKGDVDLIRHASFYQKNGYRLLDPSETARLLRTYWSIPERQVQTSVVLAGARWS
jgi:hypothetical protein